MTRGCTFRRALLTTALTALVAHQPRLAIAEGFGQCRVVDVDFTTAPYAGGPFKDFPSQMVIWLEKPSVFPSIVGEFIDTIYITQQTGRFGIGNRPGRIDFNSGPLWPYGRRDNVFPIWAHRHIDPLEAYPSVIFHTSNCRVQGGVCVTIDCETDTECEVASNDNRGIAFCGGTTGCVCDGQRCRPRLESALSHSPDVSSQESHFCRPLRREGQDAPYWDAGTCASSSFTDKGRLSSIDKSLYPPRADLVQGGPDSPDVALYEMINSFDAISRPTPMPGTPSIVTWSIPPELESGDYVMWVEVSKEFDHNSIYSVAARPSPVVFYSEYGEPYRGQPSVVYKVRFTVGGDEHPTIAADYAGYGDPDGIDGTVREPDGTITTDVLGSGGARLALRVDATLGMFRVRVDPRTEQDGILPSAPTDLGVVGTDNGVSTIAFVAPGDDGVIGTAREYEIRFRVGADITEADFATAAPLDGIAVIPALAGEEQMVELKTLLPQTDYTIAIRAIDNCKNVGPIATLRFTTPERKIGEVDACFIATAAYGSVMAEDVGMLRRFRDAMLRNSVIGELVVESYYTFGPAVAGVIGESDLLRATARGVLTPIVSWVRIFGIGGR